jgi:histidinol phosphatase-like PHP family hydrolase
MQELAPREIAAEIERKLDFLEVPLRVIPRRHHSLRAVFDRSWAILDPREKKIFHRLSIFRGTFSLEAAQEIASASLHVISALVDKSLVQDQGGRYRLHGLLRQYAAEKLEAATQEKKTLEEKFAAFYTGFLNRQTPLIESAQHNETMQRITRDFENIRLAWQLAASRRDYEMLDGALDGLFKFLRIRSWLLEGIELLANTLENWDEAQKCTRLYFKMLARQGALMQFTGEPAAADLIRQGLESANRYGDRGEQIFCLVMLTNALRRQGDWGQVELLAKHTLEISEQTGNTWGIVHAYFFLGNMILNRGEIEAAEAGKLPVLVGYEEIKGDAHVHSKFSDGTASVEEIAAYARGLGLKWVGICDHSQGLKVAGGLPVEKVLEKKEAIRAFNRRSRDVKLLVGTEVDILADGRLDYPDEILKEFDLVIAAIHSGFKQDEATLTKRIVSAMRNPFVHAIAHPTGRLLGEREPYAVDMEEIIRVAGETRTALEINAYYKRLDLNDIHTRAAKEAGVKLLIGTDAHLVDQMNYLHLGVAVARRGWCEKEDVLNTLGYKEFLKYLKEVREWKGKSL